MIKKLEKIPSLYSLLKGLNSGFDGVANDIKNGYLGVLPEDLIKSPYYERKLKKIFKNFPDSDKIIEALTFYRKNKNRKNKSINEEERKSEEIILDGLFRLIENLEGTDAKVIPEVAKTINYCQRIGLDIGNVINMLLGPSVINAVSFNEWIFLIDARNERTYYRAKSIGDFAKEENLEEILREKEKELEGKSKEEIRKEDHGRGYKYYKAKYGLKRIIESYREILGIEGEKVILNYAVEWFKEYYHDSTANWLVQVLNTRYSKIKTILEKTKKKLGNKMAVNMLKEIMDIVNYEPRRVDLGIEALDKIVDYIIKNKSFISKFEKAKKELGEELTTKALTDILVLGTTIPEEIHRRSIEKFKKKLSAISNKYRMSRIKDLNKILKEDLKLNGLRYDKELTELLFTSNREFIKTLENKEVQDTLDFYKKILGESAVVAILDHFPYEIKNKKKTKIMKESLKNENVIKMVIYYRDLLGRSIFEEEIWDSLLSFFPAYHEKTEGVINMLLDERVTSVIKEYKQKYGKGIASQILKRILEEGYLTKNAEEGLEIGLKIAEAAKDVFEDYKEVDINKEKKMVYKNMILNHIYYAILDKAGLIL